MRNVGVLFFYAILIGLKSVTKTSLPDIDLGSLLALYGVFQFTGALWRTFASNILNESLLGTIEHLSLARGGLLTQLTVRAFVLGLNGGLYAAVVLLVLYWVSGISLQPSWWWPLGVLAFLPINRSCKHFDTVLPVKPPPGGTGPRSTP